MIYHIILRVEKQSNVKLHLISPLFNNYIMDLMVEGTSSKGWFKGGVTCDENFCTWLMKDAVIDFGDFSEIFSGSNERDIPTILNSRRELWEDILNECKERYAK